MIKIIGAVLLLIVLLLICVLFAALMVSGTLAIVEDLIDTYREIRDEKHK